MKAQRTNEWKRAGMEEEVRITKPNNKQTKRPPSYQRRGDFSVMHRLREAPGLLRKGARQIECRPMQQAFYSMRAIVYFLFREHGDSEKSIYYQ
jgi:hypothetical protein